MLITSVELYSNGLNNPILCMMTLQLKPYWASLFHPMDNWWYINPNAASISYWPKWIRKLNMAVQILQQ